MNSGYIKLWRKTLESPVWQNPKLFRFWMWCLMKASHKEREALGEFGFRKTHLLPGQFVFGRKSAATETGLSERTIRSCLDCLKDMGSLRVKATNRFSILTIKNWDIYQEEQPKTSSETITETTGVRPSSDFRATTDKNVKNVKNVKNNYSVGFLSFWKAYPKKISKGDAWSAWRQNKKNMPELSVLLEAIEKQKQSAQWNKNGGQFIPGPGKWIRQCKWEDEIGPVEQPTSLRAFMESQE